MSRHGVLLAYRLLSYGSPIGDAQSPSALQSPGRLLTIGRGFIAGTCDSNEAPSVLGYKDRLLEHGIVHFPRSHTFHHLFHCQAK